MSAQTNEIVTRDEPAGTETVEAVAGLGAYIRDYLARCGVVSWAPFPRWSASSL
jgi:hypothetical protein